MTLSYIIWNVSPEIFSIGSFALRWYGLLFALGFLLSQQVLYYIFGKEGKPKSDVEVLTIYMVVATVLGARLGHVIFYQPEMIWTDPLAIFLPFEFSPSFRFTGLQGLASHGGAFGILFALWLYSRKKKPGQNYLQILDRIVIVVALTGALIRLGNFFNSEIIGKPSDNPFAVVFANHLTEKIEGNRDNSIVSKVKISKDESSPHKANARVPVNIFIFFKPNVNESDARFFVKNDVQNALVNEGEFFDQAMAPLEYALTQDGGIIGVKIKTYAIARHPAQMYESISCVILFLVLFWMWTLHKEKTAPGRIFGVFLIVLWTLRFLYEFLKENQVPFENGMQLNMGQILSIPLMLAGVFVLVYSYRNNTSSTDSQR